MAATLSGLAAACAGLLLHFLAVRLAPALARPLPLLAGVGLGAFGLGLGWGGVAPAAYAALLGAGLTLCHLLLYIGVEHDSPTLALAGFIERHGETGMAETEIEAFVASHPFTAARLGKLVEHRLVVLEQGRYRLRGRLGGLVALAGAYRRLAGMDRASG